MTIQNINALVGKFINTRWMRVCTVIGILFIFWILPSITEHKSKISIIENLTDDEKQALDKQAKQAQEAQTYYENGMSLYNKHQFSDAITWFEQSANRGHPNAQEMLVKAKQAEAQEWYEEGMKYYNNRQFYQAAIWLESSADRGNLKAQEMLDYEDGKKPSTRNISFETTLQWKANYERGGY